MNVQIFGFEIAAGGPDAIKAHLHEAANKTIRRHNCKAKTVFGEFYSWLAFTATAKAFDPVRTVLREQILQNDTIRSE